MKYVVRILTADDVWTLMSKGEPVVFDEERYAREFAEWLIEHPDSPGKTYRIDSFTA